MLGGFLVREVCLTFIVKSHSYIRCTADPFNNISKLSQHLSGFSLTERIIPIHYKLALIFAVLDHHSFSEHEQSDRL